jgi:ElaB/YqjD/DUF883 family membrane-anchored ribosome-binding protein
MPMNTLADAFYDELRDVLSAEKQLLKALPKMAKAASCEKLTAAIEKHLAETKQQVERVEKAFDDTGKAAKAKTCETRGTRLRSPQAKCYRYFVAVLVRTLHRPRQSSATTICKRRLKRCASHSAATWARTTSYEVATAFSPG